MKFSQMVQKEQISRTEQKKLKSSFYRSLCRQHW